LIFLDTGFVFALFVEGDAHTLRVREVFEAYRGRRLGDILLTTNHVISETVTLLRKRGHPDPRARHRLAVDVGEQLFAGTLGRVHWTNEAEERVAFAYFRKHDDQVYSFVDCVSFVVMEKYGITEALAVDPDFEHRFIARPGTLRKR
jgi:predicted nucleic acid-binding protein